MSNKITFFLLPITGFRLNHAISTPCIQCNGSNPFFDICFTVGEPSFTKEGRKMEKSFICGLYCCSEECFNMLLISGCLDRCEAIANTTNANWFAPTKGK